ncbi:hypothetical protein EV294_11278 [Paenibacillus sp. BK033]|uniref:hypothetical protein n=1 Tax=Paenibacillus sp. BK033 TaxID=2512133 RepID=UPI0010459F42|nr:hypothetical protein [Paenibacillus sp. BK033]TCM89613.1 hypothetical protein EV294_11278 [Paenibacillus sp. BK033]
MKADFEPVRDFTKVHNALFTLYTRLPDFKAEHAMLYTYLMARFNPSYGYAFPTSCDIALALNCGINQVTAYKRVLKKYGLIATRRHPTYGNDVYTLRAPIVEEAEFYAAFPDASDYYERRLAQLSARKERPDKADAVEDTGEMAALADWL